MGFPAHVRCSIRSSPPPIRPKMSATGCEVSGSRRAWYRRFLRERSGIVPTRGRTHGLESPCHFNHRPHTNVPYVSDFAIVGPPVGRATRPPAGPTAGNPAYSLETKGRWYHFQLNPCLQPCEPAPTRQPNYVRPTSNCRLVGTHRPRRGASQEHCRCRALACCLIALFVAILSVARIGRSLRVSTPDCCAVTPWFGPKLNHAKKFLAQNLRLLPPSLCGSLASCVSRSPSVAGLHHDWSGTPPD